MLYRTISYRDCRFPVLVMLLALTFVGSLRIAGCETNNSWVRGSAQGFASLIDQAHSLHCRELSCSLQMQPILLTVKTPTTSLLRIQLESAQLAAPISTNDGNSGALRSANATRNVILLRGFIPALPDSHELWPVSASISSANGKTVLTLNVPPVSNRRGGKHPLPITLRSVLSNGTADLSNRAFRPNARAELSSRYAFAGISCAIAGQNNVRSVLRENTAQAPLRANQTYPTIYVATDFDTQFANRMRCSSVSACNNAIVQIVHSASVFYERQLGYTLVVARQFGPTSIGGSTYPPTVLDAAQQLSLQPRRTFLHTRANTTENQVDLFQFFTGRTMREKTIGIAYVGTACRDDEVDFAQSVVQHVSNSLDPIITAHEIGHTLDALHTSSGIMRPQLGSNSPKSFASPSILAISNHLDSWYPECRQGFSQGNTTPTPTPRPDGSSSSNPHTGKPVTMTLTAQSRLPRTILLSTTVTSVNPACSVLLRGGATSLAALRGEPLIQFIPTQLTTTKKGTVSFRVPQRTSTGSNVYFVAEHTCSDGTILEVSRIRKFNPNRIRGISRSQKSKRAWLNALRQSLSSSD